MLWNILFSNGLISSKIMGILLLINKLYLLIRFDENKKSKKTFQNSNYLEQLWMGPSLVSSSEYKTVSPNIYLFKVNIETI